MEAYCMKCKEKREAKDVTMKNGKPAREGVCPVCGTKMFRIGAAKPAAQTAEEEKALAKAKGASKAKGATK